MNRLCMGCMKMYDDRYRICPYCGYEYGTAASQAYHMEPGTILQNRYVVGKVLGFGGFGVTYIGMDYLMERRVAIKEYLPSEFATRIPAQEQVTVYPGAGEEQFQAGLRNTVEEAKRLARVGAVMGIVQIYDCFEANGTAYLIMEYLDGISLKDYLETHGPLTVEQALPVVLQIASAMTEVHRAGILHRDIAPDNIYVLNPDEPDNLQVKLLDFGAARFATTKYSKSLSVILKPGYAPEEQYGSRGDQGTWTDVYALAATFYKMLTGITPEESMERKAKDELKRPSKLGVDISKTTETALMNALNVNIQDRTRTMAEFSDELMSAEVLERQATKEKQDMGKLPKWFLGLAGAGIGVAALAAVLIFTGVIPSHLEGGKSQVELSMVRVPNVVNKDAVQAERTLKWEQLEMVRDKAVFSNEIPENRICYQEMKENTLVERHSSLVVWISKGKERAVFPFVKGMQWEEAQELLKKAGFTEITMIESNQEGLYQSVLEANQEPGANIPLDTGIVLTVCMKEAEPEETEQLELVPDLDGLDWTEAEALLDSRAFRANRVEQYSELPEGMVIRQSPQAGEEAALGSYVTVYVSRGEEIIYMQYVLDISEQEARAQIEAMGLTVGAVTQEYSDTVPRGNVIAQSIPANEAVKKGDRVDLSVSMGPDPKKIEEARRREEAEQIAAEANRQAAEAAAAEEASLQAAEAEIHRQAAEAAAEEASRQAAEAAAEEASRQAAEAAAAEADRQAAEAAAAEADRQAAEAAAAEASRQAAEAAAAEASRQAAEAAAAETQGSNVVSASGRRTVSSKVTIKDLRGMTLEEARDEIEDMELILGGISQKYHDEVPEGCVISQSISSGKKVSRETTINLVVSLGPDPAWAE